MKTDDLIDVLVMSHDAVEPAWLARVLAFGIAGSFLVVVASVLATIGARADVAAALRMPAVWFKHGALTALCVSAAALFLTQLRPASPHRRALTAVVAVGLTVAVFALFQLAMAPATARTGLIFGQNWLACLTLVPLYALLPFAALLAVARQGAPVNLRRAGASAGLLAGSLSAAGYAIHCTDDTAPFLAVWYGVAILIATAAGAWAGPRFMRW